ncbi:50S ribosomal protein L35 [Halonatronum saccharophilum]|uniref:50S ribosomal protein L35 n=1 Tax=Halonatronum saccharophilum TaxID=150060 RepID=UPI00048078F7|nr:50S ribosomal protein L35 [Halonatronum saccharophilum]
MGKMKTHKGTKKRFKKTGSGNYKRTKAFRKHLMTSKSGDRKRSLRKEGMVHKNDYKRVDEVLPYE